MGFVQWAVADELPPQVKAIIPQVSESALTLEFLRKDGYSLEMPFGWGVMVGTQERSFPLLRQRSQNRRTELALRTLPLGGADVAGHRATLASTSRTSSRTTRTTSSGPGWTIGAASPRCRLP